MSFCFLLLHMFPLFSYPVASFRRVNTHRPIACRVSKTSYTSHYMITMYRRGMQACSSSYLAVAFRGLFSFFPAFPNDAFQSVDGSIHANRFNLPALSSAGRRGLFRRPKAEVGCVNLSMLVCVLCGENILYREDGTDCKNSADREHLCGASWRVSRQSST